MVDAGSKAELDSYAARVKQATGAELAFVTVQSLEDEPIEDVANDLFHAWGIGQKGEDNGAMVLLSIGDRKSRLEVGGGLGEAVPDGMAGLLLDDMRPALREGRYGAALVAAAERLGSTIAQSKGVTIEPIAAQYHVRPGPEDAAPALIPIVFLLIFFSVFAALIVFRIRAARHGRYGGGGGGGGFWMIGGGGDSGGGFGGFDSGSSDGGFDGFGGGDSGGGGASSDW